jgi:hypothetical protein
VTVSAPAAMLAHGAALSCSSLSIANVVASVMCPPKELFFVVEIIKPARANRAMAKMNKAMITSISEKPFDLLSTFNVAPPEIDYFGKSKYHAIESKIL